MKHSVHSENHDTRNSLDREIEALERKFSDVRGNPIMEDLLDTVKEYFREKSTSDDV